MLPWPLIPHMLRTEPSHSGTKHLSEVFTKTLLFIYFCEMEFKQVEKFSHKSENTYGRKYRTGKSSPKKEWGL